MVVGFLIFWRNLGASNILHILIGKEFYTSLPGAGHTLVLFFLCIFSINARCSSYIVITSTNSPILLLTAHPKVPLLAAEARNPLQSGGLQGTTHARAEVGFCLFPYYIWHQHFSIYSYNLSVDGWTDTYIKLFLLFFPFVNLNLP